jgi:hypothetical protein
MTSFDPAPSGRWQRVCRRVAPDLATRAESSVDNDDSCSGFSRATPRGDTGRTSTDDNDVDFCFRHE